MRRGTRIGALAAVAGLLLAGCGGYDDTPLPEASEAPSTTPADTPECSSDLSPLVSYDPGTGEPDGPKVEQIRKDQVLKVGVSADTLLMASRNPATNKIEGFDIEFARAIGAALFDNDGDGKDFEIGKNIQFVVITAAERIPALQDGDVDLVVRNFTVNCERWDQIAFSAEYYHASQKVLLRSELAEGYTGVEDLEGKKVCAPTGSTSLANFAEAQPDATLVPAANHTGCLIKLQRGEVDAITGDDTVLAGLAAQDPYAVVPPPCTFDASGEPVPPCQEPLSDEPYGIGANADDKDLVRFVNHVIEQMKEDGAWDRAYSKWLKGPLGKCETDCQPGDQGIAPDQVYGRV